MRKALAAATLGMATMLSGSLQAGTLVAYMSAPGVVSSEIVGTTTEGFNDSSLLSSIAASYNSILGTYSVSNGFIMPVILSDQYGGADNSQYMYVGQRRDGDATQVTLDLAAPANYFGFWWSAGDATNVVSIYSGPSLIASFQTSDITNLLASPTVQALNGNFYQSSSYYGNPSPGPFNGQDVSEPFAYVSLVATGLTFDRIVFGNIGGSGFENDNHSVYAGALNIPQDYTSFVEVSDLKPSPEPSTCPIIGLGLLLFLRTCRLAHPRRRCP